MPFWVYILRCADNTYYTGHTDDLERRLAQHQTGAFGGYTSTRLPVEMVFSEEFQTRDEAKEREHQVKAWGWRKKAALIRGDWAELARLSRGRPSAGSSGKQR